MKFLRNQKTFLLAIVLYLNLSEHTNTVLGDGLPSSCQAASGGIIDCSNMGVEHVPRPLPPSTKTLLLKGNLLESIEPSDFPHIMTDLEVLDLSANKIATIDISIFCQKLPNLKILRLTKNQLTSLPDLRACSGLTELYVSNNNLTDVDGAIISDLARLETLDLSENSLISILFSMFSPNTSIKELFLKNNELSSVSPTAFANSALLEKLDISGNKLVALPKGIFTGLKSLLSLDLSNNQLASIGQLPFLHLRKVESLSLANNSLESLPGGAFYACEALEYLNLDSNLLTSVDSGAFYYLYRLKHLSLTNNNISSIDKSVWANLISLLDLDLSHNKLQIIYRNDFKRAKEIQNLKLASNKIQAIEDSGFEGLSTLETLDLSGNEVSNIVQSSNTSVFHRLTKLKLLNLSENRLQTISPSMLKGLNSLQVLRLDNNPVATVDSYAFSTLPNLKEMSLSTVKIICDCKVSWLPQWLNATGFSNTTEAQCEMPISVKDQSIFEVDSSQFVCNPGVIPAAPYILREFPSASALKGVNITLSCMATANSPSVSIEWKKNNLSIPEMEGQIQTVIENSDAHVALVTTYLQLENVDESMEGSYQCGFITGFGQAYSEGAPLEVVAAPSFTIKPDNITVSIGQDAKFWCAGLGRPQPWRSWTKDGGGKFPAARDRRFRVDLENYNEFVIEDVGLEDRGEYHCNISNKAGSVISSATLTVLVPPYISNISTNVTVRNGHDAILHCEVSGIPQPSLSWRKAKPENASSVRQIPWYYSSYFRHLHSWSRYGDANFSAIEEGRFFVNPNNSNEFIIKNVEWKDRGLYYCNATNVAGSTVSRAMVNILMPPIFSEPMSCNETANGDYLLKCRTDSNPKAFTLWFKEGRIISVSLF